MLNDFLIINKKKIVVGDGLVFLGSEFLEKFLNSLSFSFLSSATLCSVHPTNSQEFQLSVKAF
jgi:hypothetical protein